MIRTRGRSPNREGKVSAPPGAACRPYALRRAKNRVPVLGPTRRTVGFAFVGNECSAAHPSATIPSEREVSSPTGLRNAFVYAAEAVRVLRRSGERMTRTRQTPKSKLRRTTRAARVLRIRRLIVGGAIAPKGRRPVPRGPVARCITAAVGSRTMRRSRRRDARPKRGPPGTNLFSCRDGASARLRAVHLRSEIKWSGVGGQRSVEELTPASETGH